MADDKDDASIGPLRSLLKRFVDPSEDWAQRGEARKPSVIIVYAGVLLGILVLNAALSTQIAETAEGAGPLLAAIWIAVGIGVGQWLLLSHTPADVAADAVAAAQDAGRADAFKLSALLGVVMGVYCFTLPHTPPADCHGNANATMEALGEIRAQPLITLFLLDTFYFILFERIVHIHVH